MLKGRYSKQIQTMIPSMKRQTAVFHLCFDRREDIVITNALTNNDDCGPSKKNTIKQGAAWDEP